MDPSSHVIGCSGNLVEGGGFEAVTNIAADRHMGVRKIRLLFCCFVNYYWQETRTIGRSHGEESNLIAMMMDLEVGNDGGECRIESRFPEVLSRGMDTMT